MHFLSPYFYLLLVKAKKRTWLLPFVCFLLTYALIHFYNGVDLKSFIVSNILFTLTYLFVVSCWHFVNSYEHLGTIFRQILVFNAVMALIAIPFFFFPRNYQEIFWYINKLTRGVTEFPRLALLTYEASYYSLLMVPILYYYLLKFFFNTINNNKWLTLGMAVVPVLMSLSFGVLGATFITAVILCLVFSKKLFTHSRAFLITLGVILLLVCGALVLWFVFPDSPLVIRFNNIILGYDTSAKGRTTESFTMAWRIADERSLWFGTGLGQTKILIKDIIGRYFKYWGAFPRYDIPNAMGETLAIFGIVGVFIRLFIEIWLFFKTRVYTNYYRLSLFLFMFIYQFTGSFITNIVEYVIWILAFSNVFDFFNITPQKKQATFTPD